MRLLDLDLPQIHLVASASLVEDAIIRDELRTGRRSRAQAEQAALRLLPLLGGQLAVMARETKDLPDDLNRPVILTDDQFSTLRALVGGIRVSATEVESGTAHPENLPEDLRDLSEAARRADALLGQLDRAAVIPWPAQMERAAVIPDALEWRPSSRPAEVAPAIEDVTRAVDRIHVLMSTGIIPPFEGRWDVAYPATKWAIEACAAIKRGTGDQPSPRDFLWRLSIDQLKSRARGLLLKPWELRQCQWPVESFYAGVLLDEISSLLAAAETSPELTLDSPSPLFWQVLTYVAVVAHKSSVFRNLKWEYDLYRMALAPRGLRPSIEKVGEAISLLPFAASGVQPRTSERLAAPGLLPTPVQSSEGQHRMSERLAAPGLFPTVQPLGAIAYAVVPTVLAILLGVPVLGAIFAALTAISPPRWDYRPPLALVVFNAIVVAVVSWAATGRADTITLIYLAILAVLSIPLRTVVSRKPSRAL